MKTINNTKIYLAAGLLGLASGCGQAPLPNIDGLRSSLPAQVQPAVSTPDSIAQNLLPGTYAIPDQDAVVNGQSTWTFPSEARTDSLLKVRIIPEVSMTQNAYGCVQLDIQISGARSRTITTPVMRVAGTYSQLCAGAPESYTADFSRYIPRDGSAIQIKLSNPRNDFWCQIRQATYQMALPYGSQYAEEMANEAAGLYAQSCPTKAVLAQDSIHVRVQVQLNGTQRIVH